MGTSVEVGAEFGFTLGDVGKELDRALDPFKRDPKPIRRKMTAASEFPANAAATQLTIVRVTPAGGAPVGRMWDVRAIWIGMNSLASNGAISGVMFIGNSSQAMTTLSGLSDTFKVEDAVVSFTGIPYSNSWSKFTYTLTGGDELYVGLFNTSAGGSVYCNARVDEWLVNDVEARRI